MKKHSARILALAMALCMTLSLASISTAETAYPETLSFSVKNWVKADYYNTIVHTTWMDMMTEYMGKNLDIKWVEMPYDGRNEAMKLYMAAGQYDDVFIAQADKSSLQQLGDAGLLVNLMDYKEDLTYYTPWLEDNNNLQRLSSAAGAVYGFGLGEIGEHYGNQQVFAYREDTFAANDLAIPTTQEEFYQTARKLKELYPESYPIGGGLENGDYNFYSIWMLMNHTYYSMYYNGERFVYGPADDSEAFLETLTYLNKLWGEGLIDPESMSQSNEQGYERMVNGRNYIVPDYWTGESARVNIDDVKWAFAARPLSYKGETGWKFGSLQPTYKLADNDMMVISSKSKVIPDLIKFLDYQYSREIIDLINWGVEGVTYNVVDGVKKFIDEIRNAQSPRAAAEPYGLLPSSSQFPGIRAAKERGAWSGVFPGINVFADGRYFVYDDIWKFTNDYEAGRESVFPNETAPPVQLDEDENNLRSEIISPLDTYVKESVMQFITGAKPLSDFASWQQSLANVGDYPALLEMMNSKIGVN
jgi:putative aldouronate transport system substrate-binding protein